MRLVNEIIGYRPNSSAGADEVAAALPFGGELTEEALRGLLARVIGG